ncbi:MAG: hypothetical protein WCK31_00105 [bacterium]
MPESISKESPKQERIENPQKYERGIKLLQALNEVNDKITESKKPDRSKILNERDTSRSPEIKISSDIVSTYPNRSGKYSFKITMQSLPIGYEFTAARYLFKDITSEFKDIIIDGSYIETSDFKKTKSKCTITFNIDVNNY